MAVYEAELKTGNPSIGNDLRPCLCYTVGSMQIVSLAPFITDYLDSIGKGPEIVGISHACTPPKDAPVAVQLTETGTFVGTGADALIERELCLDRVDVTKLLALKPDLILTSLPEDAELAGKLKTISDDLTARLGKRVLVQSFFPTRLMEIYTAFEAIAELAGAKLAGHDRSQRIQAQLMSWADNFYDRMKNKKVTFISSIKPLQLAGWWIPDLIRLCSAHPQNEKSGEAPVRVNWNDVVTFNPDVIVVAPEGETLAQSMSHFKEMEKFPNWEEVIAVKRGQVTFADGDTHFYRPGPTMISTMGILVSAIAGLDSGYITERDLFQRLRWVEMQRHRI